jgi:hypothetical protein
VKPNDKKFDDKIALAAWGVLAVLLVVGRFSLWGAIIPSSLMMLFLLWRIVLWDLRKKAKYRRVTAYWMRPGARDDVHLVRDVMNS